jgi:hypothetical protein
MGVPVRCTTADAAKEEDGMRVVKPLEDAGVKGVKGVKSGGVMHAAASLDDHSMVKMDWASAEAVTRHGVQGEWRTQSAAGHQAPGSSLLHGVLTGLFCHRQHRQHRTGQPRRRQCLHENLRARAQGCWSSATACTGRQPTSTAPSSSSAMSRTRRPMSRCMRRAIPALSVSLSLSLSAETCVIVASGAAYGVSDKAITINVHEAGDYLRMLQEQQVWESVAALKGIVHASSVACTVSMEPSMQELETSHAIGSLSHAIGSLRSARSACCT